jgi:hypothetical protein
MVFRKVAVVGAVTMGVGVTEAMTSLLLIPIFVMSMIMIISVKSKTMGTQDIMRRSITRQKLPSW